MVLSAGVFLLLASVSVMLWSGTKCLFAKTLIEDEKWFKLMCTSNGIANVMTFALILYLNWGK